MHQQQQQYGNNSNMYASSGNVRIRRPHPHDVLSGRGGGINSHPGNKTFRAWVADRKEAYNLAITKAEKAEVAHEVMNLVRSQQPPGRFLTRDTSSSAVGQSWWVEVDGNRALAKTSQALREGAPQIRAAHKEELGEKMEQARKSRRRSRPAAQAAPAATLTPLMSNQPMQAPSATMQPMQPPQTQTKSPVVDEALRALQKNVELARTQAEQNQTPVNLVPPLMSNSKFDESYNQRPQKKTKFERILPPASPAGGGTSSSSRETPPLTSVPSPREGGNGTFQEPKLVKPLPMPRAMSQNSAKALMRTNSLALSDFSQGDMKEEDLTGDFVDPFADESNLLIDDIPSQTPPRPKKTPPLRNVSSVSSAEQQQSGKNSLGPRYVSPEFTSQPGPAAECSPIRPPSTPPRKPNCFCDCGLPYSSGECICSELADHLLHRADGLGLYVHHLLADDILL
eukprot:scaffold4914_cov108-Cylindrotheca_fusiformis.AAC.7